MAEKLIIKNFGPIKSVELELRRFNVLIGEQATGKSTVAKLLAVCRYFSYIIDNESFLNVRESPFYEGLFAWGLHEFIKEDSYIQYECKHYVLTFGQGKLRHKDFQGLLVFTFRLQPTSKEFADLLNELNKIKPHLVDEANTSINWRIPTSFFQNDVARVMDNPFYLPAERGLQSVFSLGKSSIQNISDSLFNQFAQLDQIARLFKTDTVIEPLEITYKNVDGRGYVRKNTEEQYYSLFNAATGYQSTIPVVLVAKYYNELRRKSKTLIVEEPEQNLYPTAQNELIKYLVAQTMNFDNSTFLTTHSPYTLTSVNNLLYAYKVSQINKQAVDKLVPQKYWLNPADVSAYRLLNSGTERNIMDDELNQIDTNEIDNVSRAINSIWNDLLNVEVNGN